MSTKQKKILGCFDWCVRSLLCSASFLSEHQGALFLAESYSQYPVHCEGTCLYVHRGLLACDLIPLRPFCSYRFICHGFRRLTFRLLLFLSMRDDCMRRGGVLCSSVLIDTCILIMSCFCRTPKNTSATSAMRF